MTAANGRAEGEDAKETGVASGAAPSEKHLLTATGIAWAYSFALNGKECARLTKEIAAALARVEAETLERAARYVESLKNGMTCVIVGEGEADGTDGVLTRDIDGPWFLKCEIADGLRALAPEAGPPADAPKGAIHDR